MAEQLKFKCPKCGGNRVSCDVYSSVVVQDVIFQEDCKIDYLTTNISMADSEFEYACKDCGEPLMLDSDPKHVVENEYDLIEYLKGQNK